jgi:LPS-assembly protein
LPTAYQPLAALALCCLTAAAVYAGDMCPAPPGHTPRYRNSAIPQDHLVHIETDGAEIGADGNAVLNGRVTVRQDERSVAADTVTYDRATGRIDVKGAVDFEDPRLRIKGDTGSYETTGGASFGNADFQVLDLNGRGYARTLAVRPEGQVSLDQVRYTTCPVGNQDWMLQASSLTIDTVRRVGVGHGVWMQFKGVPVVYVPYISFPIGDARKSGFLFPNLGNSGNNGLEIAAPYYFNLAPNYDLTLTPQYLSRDGVQLSEEFRYLTRTSHGQVDSTFLPDDARDDHDDRAYLHAKDITDLKPGFRLDVDVASVSDVNYFHDFAVGSEQTSVTFLERRADFLYADDAWRVKAQVQNFQTIDISLDAADRPYSRVPRVVAEGRFPIAGSPLLFSLDAEAVNFLRDAGPAGVRLDLSPQVSWPLRDAGYFFVPAAGWHFTQYDLHDAAPGLTETPTRELPFARLDTGLLFERDSGSEGQRTQTLEPRLVYSYVPYRPQNELPVFDTALPDLNLTELFRTNRYVGDDRIGDADQLSAGLTTRLFDHVTGQQYISATLGQTRYFAEPRVTLPCYLNVPCELPYVHPASDLIGQVDLTAYKNWSFDLEYQWNPYTSTTDKSEVGMQYRLDPSHVVNLAYRFQREYLGTLDPAVPSAVALPVPVLPASTSTPTLAIPGETTLLQLVDGSFAWPIGQRWNVVGRMEYSLKDRQTIEQVAGVEYKSCCWRIQVVQRRYVSSRAGGLNTLDTSIALQLQLIGLGSVGKPADAFLERSIRGYSAGPPPAPLSE